MTLSAPEDRSPRPFVREDVAAAEIVARTLTDGDTTSRGYRPLARFARLAGPHRWRLVLAVLAGVAAAGSSIGLTATSAWLISRAAQHPPVLYLMVAVTSVRLFGVSRGVFRYLERLASHDAAFRVLGKLRTTVYRRLERLAPAGLVEFRSGDLLSRMVDDVDGLADLWLRLLLPYFTAIVVVSACVAGLWLLVPGAGIALGLSVAVVAIGVPALTMNLARRADERLSTIRGELSTASLELLAGAPELLVAGALEPRLADLAAVDGRLRAAESRLSLGTGTGAFLSALAGGAAVWFALVAGIAALRAGTLDGVALAVVVLTPIAIHETIGGLVPAAQHLPGLAAMARRVAEVTSRPDPVVEPVAPARPPAGPYGLRTRGLRARYAPSLPDALAMPDVELRPGRKLLVTGPSGSGKSTFAAILVRFLDPSAGSVELVGADGSVDLRALESSDVRRLICLCEQEPHIFDSSIRENVRLARPTADEADLVAALSAAQLMPWIERLPGGLDTLVGERGTFISAGQRQRLSLARALLADAPVIVFDEPTEHLDEAMGRALTADLLAATTGRTLVMITHRPELAAAARWDVHVDLGGPAPASR